MSPTPEQIQQAVIFLHQVGVPTEKLVAELAELIAERDALSRALAKNTQALFGGR